MKLRLFNYLSLFTIVFAICAGAQAQRPGPIGPNLPKPNPALQNEIKRQAAINKILDSKLVKMEFVIEKGGNTSITYFKDRNLALKEYNYGTFAFEGQLKGSPVYSGGNRNVTYTFTAPATATHPQFGLVSSTYRSLLKNGFVASVRFADRPKDSVRVPKGAEWSGDFQLNLYFSDGTVVGIPFQEINFGAKGTHKTTDNLGLVKYFNGKDWKDVFPDPENPPVLPVVK